MRPLTRAALDRLIWHEPGIATTPAVATLCVSPPSNVALVSVRDANRETVRRRVSMLREMKNELVAVRDEPLRVDRFEVTDGDFLADTSLDRDRLDPVKGVLQNKLITQCQDDFMRQHRVAGRRADIEEERTVRLQQPLHFTAPVQRPSQVILARR